MFYPDGKGGIGVNPIELAKVQEAGEGWKRLKRDDLSIVGRYMAREINTSTDPERIAYLTPLEKYAREQYEAQISQYREGDEFYS